MEESLIEPGHFGDSSDNILVLYDFVDPVDLRIIQRFLPTINEWDNPRETEYNEDGECIYDASYWWDRMCSASILEEINPEIFKLIDKYILKMQFAIEDKFNLAVHKRPPVLVRWLPGNEQLPHADKQLNDAPLTRFPLTT